MRLSKLIRILYDKVFLTAFFFLAVFSNQPLLAAADTSWTITNFRSDIQIAKDTSVTVTETIEVDFNNLQKHGIYRTIPVKYRTQLGNNLNIRFQLLSITDLEGRVMQVKTTREGDNLKLLIGHPDRTITGPQTYSISYQVHQVVTKPTDKAELYWNLTGHSWPVPISQASATITAPPGSLLDTICFTGYYSQSQTNCTHTHDSTTAQFSTGQLLSGQGLTISTALDPSLLTFPTFWQKLLLFLTDNWIYATPLLVFLLMFRLWYTRGRDKRYQNIFHESGEIETVPLFEQLDALAVYGPPKDLSPGEVGVLVDEKVHLRDITAIIIDLARRGFLTIKELPSKGLFKKPEFEIIFNNQPETDLLDFEKTLLDMLFGKSRKPSVKLSKLPKKAYKHLSTAQEQLYQHLTDTGYFIGNPDKVRQKYLGLGIGVGVFIFILGFGLAAATNSGPSPGIIFSSIVSSLIVIGLSFFMPARSAKGRKALKEVVGLRQWIRLGAWREQIHEKHNFFEEVLPYTIAFGLTHKFINAFKATDLEKTSSAYLKDLSWYQSSTPLSIAHFADSMDSLGSSLGSGVAATRPKSASSGGSGFGGGGFSGGGFGGGGGGSW